MRKHQTGYDAPRSYNVDLNTLTLIVERLAKAKDFKYPLNGVAERANSIAYMMAQKLKLTKAPLPAEIKEVEQFKLGRS